MLIARTIDSAPLRPPQERIVVHRRGSLSFLGRSAATPHVMTARETVTIKNAAMITRQFSTNVGSLTIRPIDRNTNELSTKATYSQKVEVAMRADAVMPLRPRRLPHNKPARTVAMTPDPPTACAATNEPYAAIVVSKTSRRGSYSRLMPSDTAAPI